MRRMGYISTYAYYRHGAPHLIAESSTAPQDNHNTIHAFTPHKRRPHADPIAELRK